MGQLVKGRCPVSLLNGVTHKQRRSECKARGAAAGAVCDRMPRLPLSLSPSRHTATRIGSTRTLQAREAEGTRDKRVESLVQANNHLAPHPPRPRILQLALRAGRQARRPHQQHSERNISHYDTTSTLTRPAASRPLLSASRCCLGRHWAVRRRSPPPPCSSCRRLRITHTRSRHSICRREPCSRTREMQVWIWI